MSRRRCAVIVALTAVGAFGMSACGPASSRSEESPAVMITSGGSETMQSQTPQDATRLLLLNDRLREELGDDYSQGWIESGELHVAVTTEEAADRAADAGAVPQIVQLNRHQLEQAVKSLAAWQAALEPELAVSIHRINSDGRTGEVTIAVAEGKVAAVEEALEKDNPTGSVPVVIVISDGLATPATSTGTTAP